MATNQLNKDDRVRIEKDIDKLVGRGLAFFKWPLTDADDQTKLISARLQPDVLAAVKVLQADGYYMRTTLLTKLPYVPVGGNERVVISLTLDDNRSWISHPAWGVDSRNLKMAPFTHAEMLKLFGVTMADKIDSWVTSVTQFHHEADLAVTVVNQILGMARTPGQLRRMIPELIGFCTVATQKAMVDQKRASSMPFEWAAYPRTPIYNSVNFLAKCYLLPSSDTKWSDRSTGTWLD